MNARALDVIDDPARARAAHQPTRLRLLQLLDRPQSAPQLAKAMQRREFHLSQELDFPTRITVDSEAHPIYTLVDIQTPDRLGLLYNLLKALSNAGVRIALSRIATEKGAAIDTFYVTDTDGLKIKDGRNIARLQQALREASQGESGAR